MLLLSVSIHFFLNYLVECTSPNFIVMILVWSFKFFKDLFSLHEVRCHDNQKEKKQQLLKVSKGAKIRNRYNQLPHLAQDTNGKVTNSQSDTTNESQEVSPFPAGDHKAHINRRAQRHSKHKIEQTHKISTKEVPPWNGQ